MVRLANGHDADTRGLRLLDGLAHGEVADQLTHAVMAVDDSGDGRFENHFGFRLRMDGALLDALVVAHHTLHAMAFDAEQVGRQQDVLDDAGLILIETECTEHIVAEAVQRFEIPFYVTHASPPGNLKSHG